MNLHCIDVVSKHFSLCRDMIDYFPDFVVWKVHELPAAFSVLHFCKKLWYMSITNFSIFTESSLSSFPAHKCATRQGQPTSKIFSSPRTPRISWTRLLRPIIEYVLSEEYVTQLSQSNENASYNSLHASYICCAVEPLLIFRMSSNDVAISPESLSTYLTKAGKNLSSLYHSFHPLLIRTSESTTAPLLGR